MKKLVAVLFLLLSHTAVSAQEPAARMEPPVAIDAALKPWLVDQPAGVAAAWIASQECSREELNRTWVPAEAERSLYGRSFWRGTEPCRPFCFWSWDWRPGLEEV